jgi:hypothetical protein
VPLDNAVSLLLPLVLWLPLVLCDCEVPVEAPEPAPPAAPAPPDSSAWMLAEDGSGSGANVTSTEKTGSSLWHDPEPPPPPDLVELNNETFWTPLINRKRTSICATVAWLVAQPASVKTGVVPGGVAELTAAADAAALPLDELAVDVEEGVEEEVDEGVVDDELLLEPDVLPVGEPILPCIEVSATPAGNTRLNSPIVADQSKREPINVEIASKRCSRKATKVMYGESCAACACTCCARAVSVAASERRLESSWSADPYNNVRIARPAINPSTANAAPPERAPTVPPPRCSLGIRFTAFTAVPPRRRAR